MDWLKTRDGAWVNVAHISQIEELKTTRGTAALMYDSAGKSLGVLPQSYQIPPGFVEACARPVYSVRSSDVLAVYVNLTQVARVAPGPDGIPMLYGPGGHSQGRLKTALDIEALTGSQPEVRSDDDVLPPPVIRKPLHSRAA
jgi:hypothetical protein